jgi:hypothetical protein
MTVRVFEPARITNPRKGVVGNVLAFLAKLSVPTAKLDLEATPDRVKRDLGFLDGRDPRYEDERLR